MIPSYIDKQEGKPVHGDGQFLIYRPLDGRCLVDVAPPKASLKSSGW